MRHFLSAITAVVGIPFFILAVLLWGATSPAHAGCYRTSGISGGNGPSGSQIICNNGGASAPSRGRTYYRSGGGGYSSGGGGGINPAAGAAAIGLGVLGVELGAQILNDALSHHGGSSGGGRHCPRGYLLTSDNRCLSYNSRRVCRGGHKYCNAGSFCTKNDRCVSMRSPRICSNGHSYCSAGYICTNDNECLPMRSDRVCSNGRSYCNPGSSCGSDGRCHRNTASYNDQEQQAEFEEMSDKAEMARQAREAEKRRQRQAAARAQKESQRRIAALQRQRQNLIAARNERKRQQHIAALQQQRQHLLERAAKEKKVQQQHIDALERQRQRLIKAKKAQHQQRLASLEHQRQRLLKEKKKQTQNERQRAAKPTANGKNCHWTSGISGTGSDAGRQYVCDGGPVPTPATQSAKPAHKNSPLPRRSASADTHLGRVPNTVQAKHNLAVYILDQYFALKRERALRSSTPRPTPSVGGTHTGKKPPAVATLTPAQKEFKNNLSWAHTYLAAAEAAESQDPSCQGWTRAAKQYNNLAKYLGKLGKPKAQEQVTKRANRLLTAVHWGEKRGNCDNLHLAPTTRTADRATPAHPSWKFKVMKARLVWAHNLKKKIASTLGGDAKRNAQALFKQVLPQIMSAPIPPKGSLREKIGLSVLEQRILNKGGTATDMTSLITTK